MQTVYQKLIKDIPISTINFHLDLPFGPRKITEALQNCVENCNFASKNVQRNRFVCDNELFETMN
jgi:hypothetical protein